MPMITLVTSRADSNVDPGGVGAYILSGGSIVKDIYEVLRKKQAEQAQLGKQIEALQTAAEQLRGVAHLLADDHSEHDAESRRS